MSKGRQRERDTRITSIKYLDTINVSSASVAARKDAIMTSSTLVPDKSAQRSLSVFSKAAERSKPGPKQAQVNENITITNQG